jgi:hypothetical protein
MFLYALVGGLALFIVSTISSLFGKKLAILCGLMAAILSWPEFSLVLSTVPWRDLAWFLRYRMEATASLLCLFVSSIYSLSRLPSVVKSSQRYAAD